MRRSRHRARVRPGAVLQWASVRLRPLTEAECYARCYGGRRDEGVNVLGFRDPQNTATESPERHERGEPVEAGEAA
jgi:hypothetical protein